MEAGGLLPRQPPQGPPGTIPVCAGQGPNGHVVSGASNVLGQSTIHELNAAAAGQLGLAGQQQLHLQQQQQMGQAPGMGEVLTPKRQAVVDRLRRRIESYRRRQTDCIPRFDQSFNGLCEQNTFDTQVLKQRFLESKAKRQAKKTDKKQSDSVSLSNVHMVSPLFFFFFFLCLRLLPAFTVRASVGVRRCGNSNLLQSQSRLFLPSFSIELPHLGGGSAHECDALSRHAANEWPVYSIFRKVPHKSSR